MHGFRPGQWVKFDAGLDYFPGAHRASDGRVVGVYHPAFAGNGNEAGHPEQVTVVTPTGENLDIKISGMLLPVRVTPYITGIQSVTDRKDIPFERIKHLPLDWQPQT